ncbi:MAG: type II toxin-antitoxin system VapC family toxin [Gammaproteobacteria bacterium]|nr:type II toxin-antitoxin system VapC family toxin [Gammaproteobacteria bacterium]
MIAIDTNVLVRFLVGDDQDQSESAVRFIDSLTSGEPGLICRETLVELVCVLERTYRFKRTQISFALYELIDSSEIVIEDVDRIREVLGDYQTSDSVFSDLMIRSTALELGATHVATFDKQFAKSPNVELLS